MENTFLRRCSSRLKSCKPFLMPVLLLLSVLCSVSSAYAVQPGYSERRVSLLKEQVESVLGFAKDTVYPYESHALVAFRPERTPVGALLLKPRELCVVIINTNKFAWSNLPVFEGLTLTEVFEFSAWHELGHCYNKKVLPLLGYKSLEPGLYSEAFADVFGLAMMKAKYPERNFQTLIASVIESRNSFEGLFTSSHFTSPILEKSRSVLDRVDVQVLSDQSDFLKGLAKLGLINRAAEKTTP